MTSQSRDNNNVMSEWVGENCMHSGEAENNIQTRCDFTKSTLVYTCRNILAPQYLNDLFSSNNAKHTHNICHDNQLKSTK